MDDRPQFTSTVPPRAINSLPSAKDQVQTLNVWPVIFLALIILLLLFRI